MKQDKSVTEETKIPQSRSPTKHKARLLTRVALRRSAKAGQDRITALVCRYFCDGYGPAAIPPILERMYGVTITREAPYKLLASAAARRWLRLCLLLGRGAERLQSRFAFLNQVDVVDTAEANGVHGASSGHRSRMIAQRGTRR